MFKSEKIEISALYEELDIKTGSKYSSEKSKK